MSDPAASLGNDPPGVRLRHARLRAGISQEELARRVAKLRTRDGIPVQRASIKAQISKWENGTGNPSAENRRYLAEALDQSVTELFGFEPSSLPRVNLTEVPLTNALLAVYSAQWFAYVGLEHITGPLGVAQRVTSDLAIIESCLVGPNATDDARSAAAHLAELAGWIAQEEGDDELAYERTLRGHTHARLAGDHAFVAVTSMRLANIATPARPTEANLHAQDALRYATGTTEPRLLATISRQLALIAATRRDLAAFNRWADIAAEQCTEQPRPGDLAPYAGPPFIASELAAGWLIHGQPHKALTIIENHIHSPVDGQQRDHAVLLARWLQALTAVGDYPSALDHVPIVINAHLQAPSIRTKLALERLTRPGDRGEPLPLATMRRRLTRALNQNEPS